MPQDRPATDAHCHLFNIYFLTSEIAEILWDKLWGNYPHKRAALGATGGADMGEIRDWLAKLLIQISQVSHASFGSYEDNLKLLSTTYQRSFKTSELPVVYPLMMDIYYMLAEPTSPAPGEPALSAAPTNPANPKAEFDKLFGELRDAVIKRRDETLPEQVNASMALGALPPSSDEVGRRLDEIYRGIITEQAPALTSGLSDGLELSKGFEQQVWDLMELRRAHPDTVFPFFAVDPRRLGIMEMITQGRHFLPNGAPLVSNNGPFFGIKLYPRLGYRPQDVDTLCPGLFRWCRDNNIPITFHCSWTGFPPSFQDWPYESFGDPDNWQPVLDKYKGLRVNFAHFGNNGDGWAAKIIKLMNAPGSQVYTDLACYTKTSDLQPAKALLEANPRLRERLMFGTDFNVMLLTDLITLQGYFAHFTPAQGIFSQSNLVAMTRTVPAGFLNGPVSATGGNGAPPPPIPPRIDHHSRNEFLKGLAGKNRFGWVRDLPDIRDYSADRDTLSKRHLENKVTLTVKKMVAPAVERARRRLPAKVDLTPWCSPIENQGAIGSCTAHAAIALVEYFEIRTRNKHIDASRLFLYKVSRNLLNWHGDRGSYIRTAMEALVLFGVPPEKYMPYSPENFDAEPSAFCYAFGQNFQTASYYRLDPIGTKPAQLLASIKETLAAGYPLMFGFTVYDSLGEANNNQGKIPFPSANDRTVGGHAIAAVGYDDSIAIQNTDPGSLPTRGGIRIRNSWGAEWGDKGYGWLPYEFVLKGLAVDWWTIIKQEWVDLENFQ